MKLGFYESKQSPADLVNVSVSPHRNLDIEPEHSSEMHEPEPQALKGFHSLPNDSPRPPERPEVAAPSYNAVTDSWLQTHIESETPPSPEVLRDLLKQNNECLSMIESCKTLYCEIITELRETLELTSEWKDQLGEWANAMLREILRWHEELKWVQKGVDQALRLCRRAQRSEEHAEPSTNESSILELQAMPACTTEDLESSPSGDVGSKGTQTLMEEGTALEPSQDEHIQRSPSMVAEPCSSYSEVLLVSALKSSLVSVFLPF